MEMKGGSRYENEEGRNKRTWLYINVESEKGTIYDNSQVYVGRGPICRKDMTSVLDIIWAGYLLSKWKRATTHCIFGIQESDIVIINLLIHKWSWILIIKREEGW